MTWVDSHCHLQMLDVPVADALARGPCRRRRGGRVRRAPTSRSSAAGGRARGGASPTSGRPWASIPTTPRVGPTSGPASSSCAPPTAVVAVGETGLDYHYEHSPTGRAGRELPPAHPARARARPRARDPLARRVGRHVPRARGGVGAGAHDRALLHGGSRRRRERALALGAHLSFSGIVSFKNADDVRAAAALTPPDRMLVETDAPFLAPVPHRGRENEPAFVGRRRRGAGGRDRTHRRRRRRRRHGPWRAHCCVCSQSTCGDARRAARRVTPC